LPTNIFPELRLWLQDRPRAARFARAVDIFGGIAANDLILVDLVLRAHGQSGAAPPFPARWARVEVTEESLWVYTWTFRHDMLFIAEHGIQAIFTVLVAAAGKPGGSAGFHLRPLTSWSILKRAARFGFGKMDMLGFQEGDVYLFFMRETPDSALRRASAFMNHTYQFDQSATTHTRRASALCVSYEWSLGRFIRVCLFGKYPWAEVVLPSIALWARGATDCFIPELLNEEQAGRLIGQVWDLQSPKLPNLLAIPVGMTRMRR